jgi:hypothetical protein
VDKGLDDGFGLACGVFDLRGLFCDWVGLKSLRGGKITCAKADQV